MGTWRWQSSGVITERRRSKLVLRKSPDGDNDFPPRIGHARPGPILLGGSSCLVRYLGTAITIHLCQLTKDTTRPEYGNFSF
ncbi:hypothetical protein ACMFMG_002454 [Clarireedia jacksonii]